MDVLIQPLLSLTSLILKIEENQAYDLFGKSLLPFLKKHTTFFQKEVGIFNNRVSLNTILTLLKHHLNAILIA